MKIGMYLAYPPSIKAFSLRQEGLGRYISFLIKAFTNSECCLTIACPSWLLDSLEELIEEENINKEKIEFLVSESEPILYKLYLKKIYKNKRVPKKRKKLITATLKLTEIVLSSIIYTRNIITFVLITMLGLFTAVVFSPILFILAIVCLIIKFIKSMLTQTFKLNKGLSVKKSLLKMFKRSKIINFFIEHITNVENIKENIRKNYTKDIRRKIKNMVNTPEVWYCPMAFWPEFNLIDGVKVVCVPDLVTSEFSTKFSENLVSNSTNEICKTIDNGLNFITYCDYVNKTVLQEKFLINPKRVKVIPHAVNDTKNYINVQSHHLNKDEYEYDVNKYFARNIVLNTIAYNNINMGKYIGDGRYGFSFKDVKYIFYSSQLRANKNIFNLIKAYEHILRVKNVPIKLFLTCNINSDKEIRDYIYRHRLQYDILSFYSVNNQQLASLYKCAELVVNPTLYEGGFPFTFGEGMSVGTPSVMSNIPQVLEVTKGYCFDKYIFNPYDIKDIAEKIIYGLENRNELIKNQTILFNNLFKRTWDDVGKEYIKAFEYFISLDNE